MGEVCKDALRAGISRAIKLECHGAQISSDAGFFRFREIDNAAQLTDSGAAELRESAGSPALLAISR